MKENIIGYYKESEVIKDSLELANEKLLYFVAFENSTIDNSKQWIEGFNVLEGHFELEDRKYLLSCNKITKDEYLKATKGFHTPREYL